MHDFGGDFLSTLTQIVFVYHRYLIIETARI